jgi:hypothetical protein
MRRWKSASAGNPNNLQKQNNPSFFIGLNRICAQSMMTPKATGIAPARIGATP